MKGTVIMVMNADDSNGSKDKNRQGENKFPIQARPNHSSSDM